MAAKQKQSFTFGLLVTANEPGELDTWNSVSYRPLAFLRIWYQYCSLSQQLQNADRIF